MPIGRSARKLYPVVYSPKIYWYVKHPTNPDDIDEHTIKNIPSISAKQNDQHGIQGPQV